MEFSIPLAKDLMAIVGPWISPLFGAWVGITTVRRAERSRLSAYISWEDAGDPDEGQPGTLPFVHIQNLSSRHVGIVDVHYMRGFMQRKRAPYWAIYDEYGDNNPFPLLIDPGKVKRLALDPEDALRFTKKQTGKLADRTARMFKRQRIRLRITAMSGEKLTIGAEDAIRPRDAHPAFSGI